jgi:hypothetical protein
MSGPRSFGSCVPRGRLGTGAVRAPGRAPGQQKGSATIMASVIAAPTALS